MAINLTAVPDPTTASVLLTVTETTSNSASTFTLTRNDSNGVADVRRLAGQTLSGGSLVVRDYEAALTGQVTYTFNSGQSGIGSVTQTVELAVETDVLSVATLPQYRAIPNLTVELDEDLTADHVRHDIIGRSDPIFSLAPLGTRTGTVKFLSLSQSEARQLVAVYGRGDACLLRLTGGGDDLYHLANRVRVERQPEFGTRTVAVDFTEVMRPSGPLRGALGWSYASLKTRTYAQIRARYGTYAAVTIGDQ